MQKMRIVTMQLGMLATNCYLVINEETGELVIIDPAGEADRILVRVRQLKARPVAVLQDRHDFGQFAYEQAGNGDDYDVL